eukprot:m.358892 g.358892  ORF g.358892 m.358892 type:complete len:515 (-) comp16621_c0_seq1:1444-2988(-)
MPSTDMGHTRRRPASAERTCVGVVGASAAAWILIMVLADGQEPPRPVTVTIEHTRAFMARSNETQSTEPAFSQSEQFKPTQRTLMTPKPDACRVKTIPKALRTLCPLLYASLRPSLRQFYTEAKPPVTVHVADMHDGRLSEERCVRKYVAGCKAGRISGHPKECPAMNMTVRVSSKVHKAEPAYTNKFMAEMLIPTTALLSRYATASVEGADVILLSRCIASRGQGGSEVSLVPKEILKQGGVLAAAWKKRPSTFMLVLTNDHGPCENKKEPRLDEPVEFLWHSKDIGVATLLMNEGSTQQGCYRPSHDIVIPTSVVVGTLGLEGCSNPVDTPTEGRKHLAFMAGTDSSRVRFHIYNAFKNDADFKLLGPQEHVEHQEYMCLMSQSVFCLVARGQAAWSPRLDEAIFAGCIPVIIADHYDPPFSTLLDYSKFSIRVNETLVGGGASWRKSHGYSGELGRILRRIPEHTRSSLLRNVTSVRAAFRYDVPAAPYKAHGAFELIMFQTWLRKHNAPV